MIIRSSKALKNYNSLNLKKKEEPAIESIEEIIKKPVVKSNKKKKSQPIVVEPDIFIAEKVEETEDEDLSRWLKEDENVI